MAPPKQLAEHAFKPGWKGGPGRPPGKRNYLSETMLALIADDAEKNGAAVLAEVRRTKPAVWLQCVCSLLPKQLTVEKLSPFSDITDTELAQVEELLTATCARTVRELERVNGAEKQQPSFPLASPELDNSK